MIDSQDFLGTPEKCQKVVCLIIVHSAMTWRLMFCFGSMLMLLILASIVIVKHR